MSIQWALAKLMAVILINLSYVKGEARTCYFGPPPQPDPNNPDSQHWLKQAMQEIRERCPGNRKVPKTVVTCLPLSAPKHGIVSNCTINNHARVTTDRQPVGSVCDAACHDGYTLSGSARRNCLVNGAWDGTDAQCTGCAVYDLQLPSDSTLTGCIGEVPYGTWCTLVCNSGYIPATDSQTACQTDGNAGITPWNVGSVTCTVDEWLIYKHVGLEYPSIIPDDRFSASSTHEGYFASSARLNFEGSWGPPYPPPPNNWLEVELNADTVVSGVITRGGHATGVWRVTKYQVGYQTEPSAPYDYVSQVNGNPQEFSGNIDDGLIPAIQRFPQSIVATRVRIEALEWADSPVLQLEFLGSRLN